MITFSKLGYRGRLGNQLFQIAFLVSYSKLYGHDLVLPPWKYEKYFKQKLPKGEIKNTIFYKEKHFPYYKIELDANRNYDIEGWFQTEKHFDEQIVQNQFIFDDQLKSKVKNLFKNAFKKTTILLSVRRGDFVGHENYYQVPFHYYLKALEKHFTNAKDCNIIVTSDNLDECEEHLKIPNSFFAHGLSDIEQLCLGTMCDHFLISNSTFSWWQAWLGEKEHSKIVRPFKNFRGRVSSLLDDKDFFPPRWIQMEDIHHTKLI